MVKIGDLFFYSGKGEIVISNKGRDGDGERIKDIIKWGIIGVGLISFLH